MNLGAGDIEARLYERLEQGETGGRALAAISLAAVLRNRGRRDAAERLLWEAVAVDDAAIGARAWLALGEHLAESGEESGARRAYARVAELADAERTPDVVIDLAARAKANGNRRGAAALYAEVIDAEPGPTLKTLAALRLAAIHRAEGESRLALDRLEAVQGTGEGELAVEAELALAELLLELAAEKDSFAERGEALLDSVIEVDHPDHSPRAALILALRLGARRSFSRAYQLLVAVMTCGHPELSPRAQTELAALLGRRPDRPAPLCLPAGPADRPGRREEQALPAPLAGGGAEAEPGCVALSLLAEALDPHLLACRLIGDIDGIQPKARREDPPAIVLQERPGRLFRISCRVECRGEPDVLPAPLQLPRIAGGETAPADRALSFAGLLRPLRGLLAPPAAQAVHLRLIHGLGPAVVLTSPARRPQYRHLLAALRALAPAGGGELEELLAEPPAPPPPDGGLRGALLLVGLIAEAGLGTGSRPEERRPGPHGEAVDRALARWVRRVAASSARPAREGGGGHAATLFAADFWAGGEVFEPGFARRAAAPPASPWSPDADPTRAGLISAG